MGGLVIRLLLYADDLILIAKSSLGLQDHLISLEHFCRTVGMQVNTSKTKVVVFSRKRKHKQMIQFKFLHLWLPLFFMKIRYEMLPSILLKRISSISHHFPSMILLFTLLACKRVIPWMFQRKDQSLELQHSLSLDPHF